MAPIPYYFLISDICTYPSLTAGTGDLHPYPASSYGGGDAPHPGITNRGLFPPLADGNGGSRNRAV